MINGTFPLGYKELKMCVEKLVSHQIVNGFQQETKKTKDFIISLILWAVCVRLSVSLSVRHAEFYDTFTKSRQLIWPCIQIISFAKHGKKEIRGDLEAAWTNIHIFPFFHPSLHYQFCLLLVKEMINSWLFLMIKYSLQCIVVSQVSFVYHYLIYLVFFRIL